MVKMDFSVLYRLNHRSYLTDGVFLLYSVFAFLYYSVGRFI